MDVFPNSKMKIEESYNEKQIKWFWPVFIVFARLLFAFIVQSLVALVFLIINDPEPWREAGSWWVVYGTLIDVGCLMLLLRYVKREGVRLRDLVNFGNQKTGQFIFQCLTLIVLFFLLFMSGGMIFGPLIYGGAAPVPYGELPLWGAMYSIILWPVIWGITEQMTYMGYALPRLEVIFKNKWMAVGLVCFGWCIQHIALPFAFDWQWVAYRFASTLPIALVLPLLYLRSRRLLPFIIAHCIIDAAGTFSLIFLPLLQ